jgi:molecular chaperone GrpE
MAEFQGQDGVSSLGSPSSADRVSPEARAEIEAALTTFRQWLIECDAARAELLEPSDDPGIDVSLHRMIGEWSALRVSLDEDSRGSRDQLDTALEALNHSTANVEQSVKNILGPLVRDRDRLRDTMKDRLQIQQLNWMELILDLRDAFDQGGTAARTALAKAGWRRPFMPKALSAGLTAGYDLALSRIDAALTSRDVQSIDAVGVPLDPHTMKVVERVHSDDVPDGHVTEIVRSGYRCGGEVVRLAEVKVASA